MLLTGEDRSNQIAFIQNLKMVNCYQIFSENGLVDGIMAYYGDQTINLCELEEDYGELFDKLVQVYAEESKNARIVVDENTKELLTRGREDFSAEFAKRLEGFQETNMPVFLAKAFSHCFVVPIVEFLLTKLYGIQKEEIKFDGLRSSWYGKGVIGATYQKKSLHFPYQIQSRDDEHYEVTVSNVLRTGDDMRVLISYGINGLVVSFRVKAIRYQGNLILRMSDQKAELSCFIQEGEKAILAQEVECDVTGAEPTALTRRIAEDADTKEKIQWKAYRLPWGQVIYHAEVGRDEYQVFTAGEDLTISHCIVSRNLTEAGEEPIRFGKLAFRLYERDALAELHLLEMASPRFASFFEKYAGTFYEIKK